MIQILIIKEYRGGGFVIKVIIIMMIMGKDAVSTKSAHFVVVFLQKDITQGVTIYLDLILIIMYICVAFSPKHEVTYLSKHKKI